MAERWLVIDDSATIQRVIKLAFQDYDVMISEADSCADAAREIVRQSPSLVIADAAVGGAQSVQDFVNLRNHAPQTPFIILEGSYDNIDESQFRSAGFRHFLKKPFDASQLLAVTRQALGRALPYRSGEPGLPPPPPARSSLRADESPAQAFVAEFSQSRGVDLGLIEHRRAAPPTTPASPLSMKGTMGPMTPGLGHPQAGHSGTMGVKKAPQSPSVGMGEPLRDVDQRAINYPAEDVPNVSVKNSRMEPMPRGGATSLHSMLEPMLQEEMERLVKAAVEDYCRKHFAQIARELIGKELERLTQERSRLLVDK